jgi:hypothetical protein
MKLYCVVGAQKAPMGTKRPDLVGRSNTQGGERLEHKRIGTEEHQVEGDDLVAKVKEIIHQGNVRRIIIKDDDGKTLIEVPLTLGVVGAVLIPVWAAIGAIAALVTRCSIVVERVEE